MSEVSTSQPWERQSGEPSRWFARFCRYRDLGPVRRSVLAAYVAERAETTGNNGTRRPRRSPKTWDAASRKFDWRGRAELWDGAEQKRIEAEDRDARDRRRRQVVDSEWADARCLRNEALRLLSETAGWQPGKTRECGDEIRERATGPELVKLTVERDLSAVLADAAALMEKASVLSRRATGLPLTPQPEPEKSTVRAVMPGLAIHVEDFEKMSDAELKRLLAESEAELAKNGNNPPRTP